VSLSLQAFEVSLLLKEKLVSECLLLNLLSTRDLLLSYFLLKSHSLLNKLLELVLASFLLGLSIIHLRY